jgi:hypothetical protein
LMSPHFPLWMNAYLTPCVWEPRHSPRKAGFFLCGMYLLVPSMQL